jgi:23S rRNA pseudouridine1911/1915/1917 synthase
VLKPAGLSTQAPRGFDSLEVRARQWLRERAEGDGQSGNNAYLGFPHRLDRAASGVILFALTRRAARIISRQFERRQIRKIYWAVAEGAIEQAEETWIDFVRKVPDEPRVEIAAEGELGAQQAVLHYKTLAAIPLTGGHRATWLEIELETGRMHQVRIQAASRGHPILGDALYGGTVPFGHVTSDPRERPIALHARSISFRHPETSETLTVTAPPTQDWRGLNGIADLLATQKE